MAEVPEKDNKQRQIANILVNQEADSLPVQIKKANCCGYK